MLTPDRPEVNSNHMPRMYDVYVMVDLRAMNINEISMKYIFNENRKRNY